MKKLPVTAAVAAVSATLVTLSLTTFAVAAPPAQATPPRYQIEIAGPAVIDRAGPRPGTSIRFPVRVRCPLGETIYYGFAGTPGYFPADAHPTPWFYSHSAPGRIDCTGHRQLITMAAQSTERFQDPVAQPFETFRPGWITVHVQLGLHDAPVSDIERIRILR